MSEFKLIAAEEAESRIDAVVLEAGIKPLEEDWISYKFYVKDLESKLAQAEKELADSREIWKSVGDRSDEVRDRAFKAEAENAALRDLLARLVNAVQQKHTCNWACHPETGGPCANCQEIEAALIAASRADLAGAAEERRLMEDLVSVCADSQKVEHRCPMLEIRQRCIVCGIGVALAELQDHRARRKEAGNGPSK